MSIATFTLTKLKCYITVIDVCESVIQVISTNVSWRILDWRLIGIHIICYIFFVSGSCICNLMKTFQDMSYHMDFKMILLHLQIKFLPLHTWNIGRKYVFVKDDKVFDKLIYQVLILNLIFMVRNGYQRRTEADGKVVGVHHIFVTENKGQYYILSTACA